MASLKTYSGKTSLNEVLNVKSLNHYLMSDKLGDGYYGKIKLATHLATNEKVAVKFIEKSKLTGRKDEINVEREIAIMQKLKHPNIIQLLTVINAPTAVYLIMDYVNGMDLFDHIISKSKLTEKEAQSVFIQIISGINYMHENGICHRDIRLENILVDKDLNIKIIDFGYSTFIYEDNNGNNNEKIEKLLNTNYGSYHYSAPEVIKGEDYLARPAELWSLGVLLYTMVCGFTPFDNVNEEILIQSVLNAEFSFPSSLSFDCKDLIKGLLNPNIKDRYTIPQVLKHNWLKEESWNTRIGINLSQYLLPIDEEIVEFMWEKSSIIKKEVIKSYIIANYHNTVTATYYLLVHKLSKQKNDYYKSTFKGVKFEEYLNNKNNLIKSSINNKNKSNSNNTNKINQDYLSKAISIVGTGSWLDEIIKIKETIKLDDDLDEEAENNDNLPYRKLSSMQRNSGEGNALISKETRQRKKRETVLAGLIRPNEQGETNIQSKLKIFQAKKNDNSVEPYRFEGVSSNIKNKMPKMSMHEPTVNAKTELKEGVKVEDKRSTISTLHSKIKELVANNDKENENENENKENINSDDRIEEEDEYNMLGNYNPIVNSNVRDSFLSDIRRASSGYRISYIKNNNIENIDNTNIDDIYNNQKEEKEEKEGKLDMKSRISIISDNKNNLENSNIKNILEEKSEDKGIPNSSLTIDPKVSIIKESTIDKREKEEEKIFINNAINTNNDTKDSDINQQVPSKQKRPSVLKINNTFYRTNTNYSITNNTTHNKIINEIITETNFIIENDSSSELRENKILEKSNVLLDKRFSLLQKYNHQIEQEQLSIGSMNRKPRLNRVYARRSICSNNSNSDYNGSGSNNISNDYFSRGCNKYNTVIGDKDKENKNLKMNLMIQQQENNTTNSVKGVNTNNKRIEYNIESTMDIGIKSKSSNNNCNKNNNSNDIKQLSIENTQLYFENNTNSNKKALNKWSIELSIQTSNFTIQVEQQQVVIKDTKYLACCSNMDLSIEAVKTRNNSINNLEKVVNFCVINRKPTIILEFGQENFCLNNNIGNKNNVFSINDNSRLDIVGNDLIKNKEINKAKSVNNNKKYSLNIDNTSINIEGDNSHTNKKKTKNSIASSHTVYLNNDNNKANDKMKLQQHKKASLSTNKNNTYNNNNKNQPNQEVSSNSMKNTPQIPSFSKSILKKNNYILKDHNNTNNVENVIPSKLKNSKNQNSLNNQSNIHFKESLKIKSNTNPKNISQSNKEIDKFTYFNGGRIRTSDIQAKVDCHFDEQEMIRKAMERMNNPIENDNCNKSCKSNKSSKSKSKYSKTSSKNNMKIDDDVSKKIKFEEETKYLNSNNELILEDKIEKNINNNNKKKNEIINAKNTTNNDCVKSKNKIDLNKKKINNNNHNVNRNSVFSQKEKQLKSNIVKSKHIQIIEENKNRNNADLSSTLDMKLNNSEKNNDRTDNLNKNEAHSKNQSKKNLLAVSSRGRIDNVNNINKEQLKEYISKNKESSKHLNKLVDRIHNKVLAKGKLKLEDKSTYNTNNIKDTNNDDESKDKETPQLKTRIDLGSKKYDKNNNNCFDNTNSKENERGKNTSNTKGSLIKVNNQYDIKTNKNNNTTKGSLKLNLKSINITNINEDNSNDIKNGSNKIKVQPLKAENKINSNDSNEASQFLNLEGKMKRIAYLKQELNNLNSNDKTNSMNKAKNNKKKNHNSNNYNNYNNNLKSIYSYINTSMKDISNKNSRLSNSNNKNPIKGNYLNFYNNNKALKNKEIKYTRNSASINNNSNYKEYSLNNSNYESYVNTPHNNNNNDRNKNGYINRKSPINPYSSYNKSSYNKLNFRYVNPYTTKYNRKPLDKDFEKDFKLLTLKEELNPCDLTCFFSMEISELRKRVSQIMYQMQIIFLTSSNTQHTFRCSCDNIKFDIDIKKCVTVDDLLWISFYRKLGNPATFKMICQAILLKLLHYNNSVSINTNSSYNNKDYMIDNDINNNSENGN